MKSVKDVFTCAFCCRDFVRSDALKRHWNTCKIRKDRALHVPRIRTKTRGRKLRACDRCSQLKRACSATEPCSLCALRSVECTYSRPRSDHVEQNRELEEQAISECIEAVALDSSDYEISLGTLNQHENNYSPRLTNSDMLSLVADSCSVSRVFTTDLDFWDTSWTLLTEHTLSTPLCPRPTELNISQLLQFPFLDKFTKATGFVTSFDCGTRQRRLSITTDLASCKSYSHLSALSSHEPDPISCWVEITWNALTSNDEHNMRDASVVALLSKAHEIVSSIREVSLLKHRQSPVEMTWSISLEALCYEFFHPSALEKYLALFWSCWYPNWPTIHRPTFDATARSPGLVAAMALVGAFLSPDSRDCAKAQIWMDAVEEVVFSGPLFVDDDMSIAWQRGGSQHLRESHIDVMQAAYCVCLYQTWEGSRKSKRRILRKRFNDLVYLARDIGLAEASLQTVDTSTPDAFDWEEYVLRESLIRMCSYICNIDASYALFFSNPTRMAFSELLMELPSPESCFQAQSKEECFVELKTWRSRSGVEVKNPTLFTAVLALSDPTIMATGATRQVFSELSVLSMFTIVHALFMQVNREQPAGIRPSSTIETDSLVIAVKQWRELWPSSSRDAELADFARKESQASTKWRAIGFIKHAPEYRLLVHLCLEKYSRKSLGDHVSTSGMNKHGEDINMSEAKALIAEFRSIT